MVYVGSMLEMQRASILACLMLCKCRRYDAGFAKHGRLPSLHFGFICLCAGHDRCVCDTLHRQKPCEDQSSPYRFENLHLKAETI